MLRVVLLGFCFVGLLISEAQSRKTQNCVKDCKACEKECKRLANFGYDCSESKPRKPNDYCSCKGFGVLPLCKNGGFGTHPKMNWINSIASTFLVLFVTSSFVN